MHKRKLDSLIDKIYPPKLLADITNLPFPSHLKHQLPVRSGMNETGGVVIFIQHSDMCSPCCTARGRTPVLYNHNNLIAGLLLSVQCKAGANLT